ncbi:MAG: hypothetical protein ABH816_00825 [Candidatus Levyibacteriota bacterium]
MTEKSAIKTKEHPATNQREQKRKEATERLKKTVKRVTAEISEELELPGMEKSNGNTLTGRIRESLDNISLRKSPYVLTLKFSNIEMGDDALEELGGPIIAPHQLTLMFLEKMGVDINKIPKPESHSQSIILPEKVELFSIELCVNGFLPQKPNEPRFDGFLLKFTS